MRCSTVNTGVEMQIMKERKFEQQGSSAGKLQACNHLELKAAPGHIHLY